MKHSELGRHPHQHFFHPVRPSTTRIFSSLPLPLASASCPCRTIDRFCLFFARLSSSLRPPLPLPTHASTAAAARGNEGGDNLAQPRGRRRMRAHTRPLLMRQPCAALHKCRYLWVHVACAYRGVGMRGGARSCTSEQACVRACVRAGGRRSSRMLASWIRVNKGLCFFSCHLRIRRLFQSGHLSAPPPPFSCPRPRCITATVS